MPVLYYIYLSPFSKNSLYEIAKINYIPKNNEQLCTAGHCCKQKNTTHIWKRYASAPYTYVSPFLSKKQAKAGKTHTYPLNNEHLRTADHR